MKNLNKSQKRFESYIYSVMSDDEQKEFELELMSSKRLNEEFEKFKYEKYETYHHNDMADDEREKFEVMLVNFEKLEIEFIKFKTALDAISNFSKTEAVAHAKNLLKSLKNEYEVIIKAYIDDTLTIEQREEFERELKQNPYLAKKFEYASGLSFLDFKEEERKSTILLHNIIDNEENEEFFEKEYELDEEILIKQEIINIKNKISFVRNKVLPNSNLNSCEYEPTICLSRDYKEMVKSGHVRFLDADDFDAIIEYYQQQGLAKDALNTVNCALAYHGYAAMFYIKKAELLNVLEMEEEALKNLQTAEYLEASNAQIFILKAEILATLGQEGEALAALERAQFVAAEEQYADIYVAQATVYEASYNYERAFQALKNALIIQPDNTEALSRIWLFVELTENFQESADLHIKLIDEAPYAPVVWYNLGHALFHLGDYEKAADSFEYAYVIDEKFREAYFERAGALMELELYEKAIECLEDACKYAEPDAPLYTRMGYCFEQLENFADAESYYSDAIRIAPDFDEGYYRVGECLFKRKNWTSAKTAYEAAFRLDSKNALYLVALAETHYQIKNYDTAYLFFQDACDMAPDECQHWVRLATFHMAMKDYESAVAALDEAEMYNECSVTLRYCRVACLYQSGQSKAALILLQETLAEDEACHYKVLFDFAPELLRIDAVLDTINTME